MELVEDARELAIYEKGAQVLSQIQEKVKTLTVTASNLQDSFETLALAKRIVTVLDEERVKEGKPHYDTYKEINNKFTAVINPLKEMATQVESRINVYNRAVKEEQDRKQREFEAEQRKAEAERQKQIDEAKAKGETPPPAAVVPAPVAPVVEEPKTVVQTSFGKTKIKERWAYEVLDIHGVPLQWLMVDEKKVNKAINDEKFPVRDIAGLKISPV